MNRPTDTNINAKTKMILVNTCGSVVGRMRRTRKEWLSDETYRKVEERGKAKQILYDLKPVILWIGRLCGGFFVLKEYLTKSSICSRFSIRALLAKCFMEEL